jgi:hypothetical protein
MLLRQATRERRRLTVGAPTRHLELLFQPLVFTPQAVAFDLRALQVLFETLNAPGLIVDDLVRLSGRRIFRAPRHGTFMPDSRAQYKRELLGASAPRCVGGAEERISRVLTR